MLKNVLLLRSPSEDADGPDKYEEAFRARGYRPVSAPVLEAVYKNLDKLAEVLRRRGAIAAEDTDARYAGVIVTSARACEAWRVVVQELSEQLKSGSEVSGMAGCTLVMCYGVLILDSISYSAIVVYHPVLCGRSSNCLHAHFHRLKLPHLAVCAPRHSRHRVWHGREARAIHYLRRFGERQ